MNPEQVQKLSESILNYIRDGKNYPLEILTAKYKCELSDIVSAFKLLENFGYKFKKEKGGISLNSIPDTLIDFEIKHGLKSKLFGRELHTYKSVQSTNDIASRLAESGSPEGTIVISDRQTKGRGRLGRKWHSPPDKGVYLSIMLKPKCKPEHAPGISIITALALAETIGFFIEADIKIKWPNDVLLNGKKTAGILTELFADKNKIDYVIVGTGININHERKDFPEDIKALSTSLRISSRKKINRVAFLKEFIYRFEKEYLKYKKGIAPSSLKKIKKYSYLLGKEITLLQGEKKISGTALDFTRTGALIIKNETGKIEINSGEVTVAK